ncbi:branched-chain amino acid transport system II carrier protein [Rothia sp. ZJ1223]|uniref:branched-chain amino acid transport system II carrier protein n=1 Tax=Rothia sp. ZJ1223 TaxID=2811098 RepID=UPI0019590A34|nr:branched-chain amino acid transport system II carrier protein [Rothia sp. ZJ1223]MBM7051232.1 branched-chain amino acid transport system II carrier protein [Rothia sp. ZJ1223]
MSNSSTTSVRGHEGSILVASMMLFSMFFGAGNLIFPAMLGAQAGTNFWPAVLGFVSTGVILPALAVIAIAITGKDMRALTLRGGRVFGVLFPVLVYLSIGAFFALPRTASVTYSTVVTANFESDSFLSRAVFSAVFFVVAVALSIDPRGIVDRLGKYITPLLLVLLVAMIVLSFFKLGEGEVIPSETYAENPFATGFVEGYLTMDSLAGLAFGIIVLSAFKHKGLKSGPALVKGVSIAAVLACVLLGLVYVGLGTIGHRVEGGQDYSDGAVLLAQSAQLIMGPAGIFVFGLIMFLACMGTAVGLLGSAAEFFNALLPGVSYRAWVILFSLIGFAVSTMSLEQVLAVTGPLIGALYPSAITLIFLTFIEPMLRRKLHYTFTIALAVSMLWAVLMLLAQLMPADNIFERSISWSPLHAEQMGWIVPTLVAALIGYILDLTTRRKRAVPLGGETQKEAQARMLDLA